MKKNLLIFLLLIGGVLQAQYSKAVVHFRNGDTKNGYVKFMSSQDKIKFKENKKSNVIRYGFRKIKKVIIDSITYEYKVIKGKNEPQILKLEKLGKLSLYSKKVIVRTPGVPVANIGDIGISISPSGFATVYYISKKENNHLVHQITSKTTEKSTLFNRKFKKIAAKYFKDCPILVQKIKTRKLKGKHMIGLIDFYNDNCNSK